MPGVYDAKLQICEYGKRLYDARLIVSIDGNLSCRIADDEILVTPSGVCKGQLAPSMIVTTDLAGNVRYDSGKPSSEFPMHLEIYRRRPDVRAVVHAHPPTATGFAVAGLSLDQCVLTEVVSFLGAVPLVPYSTPSTEEVPRNVGPYIERANAVLLANHGATTVGETLDEAFRRMEAVEHMARILLVARQLGQVSVLTQEQVDRLYNVAYGTGGPVGWACRPREGDGG